jgi:hypothetical protein
MNDEAAQLRSEIAKLGEHGPARVAAVEQFVRATSGAGADAIIAGLTTAAHIEGFEKIMAAGRPRAEPAPKPAEPSPPRAGDRVDEAAYGRMSHAERIDYCRGFKQPTEDYRR